MISTLSSEFFSSSNQLCKTLLILGFALYFIFIIITSNQHPSCSSNSDNFSSFSNSLNIINDSSHLKHTILNDDHQSPTNLTHVAFGLLGSEKAWHYRRGFIESWWRPNMTRGFIYLDKPPTGELLPWSNASPPYKVSEDLTKFLQETNAKAPIMIRMVHGIMEVFKEVDNENLRWVVMGDDDSIFFVDNIVDVVSKYDHRKYYYFGGQSESISSNYWFSFNQGFGGAGFMLSYPLAKALAKDMDGCLRRYAHDIPSADTITMVCIADIGVNLSPNKGIHQIDLHGNLSGFLSSHPKSPLISLHHLEMMYPIFPSKYDQFESIRHLMKAANADQSRILQQTICHHRRNKWTFSVSWGYSVHIYEKIMPRSYLQNPMETFEPWAGSEVPPPRFMFNTRSPSDDPCEFPHIFYFEKLDKNSSGIFTQYSRASPRGLGTCGLTDSHSADFISNINVFSSPAKRPEMDRCECCDVIGVGDKQAQLKFRECLTDEIIA